ncbi:MAG: thiamine phosphate synthase, partial [candidate division WOR-3 bacterium]
FLEHYDNLLIMRSFSKVGFASIRLGYMMGRNDLISKIKRKVIIPIIAIGGINNKNYRKVIKAGADGIAIASYLFEGDLKKNLQSLAKRT